MSGAPLWCTYNQEGEPDKQRAIAGVLYGSRQSGVQVYSQHEILEDGSRARPEEWFWLHRRWPDAAYLPRGTGKSGSGV